MVPCVVSSTEMPDQQPEGEQAVHERLAELGAGGVLGVEVQPRRVHRHGGEEHVVGLGDRAGERVRHDEADGQVLEPPTVMRRLHSGLLVLVVLRTVIMAPGDRSR